MSEYLNIEQLQELPNVPEVEIEIEQWNTKILVKGLTKKMQVELARIVGSDESDAFDYQKALLKASVVQPKLDDEAIELLYEKDANIIDEIFTKLAEINGLSEEIQTEMSVEFQE